MRIIGGDARGRRLFAPAGQDTRPTADRIRESLFNILFGRVPGSRVLDLFGGTGALALEAISRGAEHATIVDMNRKATEVIARNAELVCGKDYRSRVRILTADYRRAVPGFAGQAFDLVFLDPPYRMENAYAEAIELLKKANAVSEDTVFVLERARSAQIPLPEYVHVYDTRSYGETAVDLAVLVPEGDAPRPDQSPSMEETTE